MRERALMPRADRTGTIKRFTPRFWDTNMDLYTSGAIITIPPGSDDIGGLRVEGITRRLGSFVGIYWRSVPRFCHPLHRYEHRYSYRGVTWSFTYHVVSGGCPLDYFYPPILTIGHVDGTFSYISLLANAPDGADPLDARVTIDFDNLTIADGSPVDVTAIDFLQIGAFGTLYAFGNTTLSSNITAGASSIPLSVPSNLAIEAGDELAIGGTLYPVTSNTSGTSQTVTIDGSVSSDASAGSLIGVASTRTDAYGTNVNDAFIVELRDFVVEGDNVDLRFDERLEPAHDLRMTDGYDNAYNLTPEHLIEQCYQLGFREDYVLYLGISHAPRYSWNGTRWLVDASTSPTPSTVLNGPTEAWLADFYARAEAKGFKVWLSTSFELFGEFAPDPWVQRNYAGVIANTGWTPPSAFISPGSETGFDFIAAILKRNMELQAAAGLSPRGQLGEPTYWLGGFGQELSPFIYDLPILTAYNDDTGLFAPEPHLESIFDAPGIHRPYLEWLGSRLGYATDYVVQSVKTAHPTTEMAMLIFPPQILSVGSEISQIINFPTDGSWSYSSEQALDILMIEDYDWLVLGELEKLPLTWLLAEKLLNWPVEKLFYFTGFVLRTDQAYQWRWVIEGAKLAFPRQPYAVGVWSREQWVREGLVWEPEAPSTLSYGETMALCWKLTRRDGEVMAFTSHDRPLLIDGLTYTPTGAFDASRTDSESRLQGGITEAGGSPSLGDIALPGLVAGLYDGAEIELFEVDWRKPAAWRRALSKGSVGTVKANDVDFSLELRGVGHKLTQPKGRVYQPLCDAVFGDARCTVDKAALKKTAQITALGLPGLAIGNDRQVALGPGGGLAAEASSQSFSTNLGIQNGEMNNGTIKFLTGNAKDLPPADVKLSYITGLIVLKSPLPVSLAVGDSFDIFPGCDKTLATCAGYDNAANYRGFPYVPGSGQIVGDQVSK